MSEIKAEERRLQKSEKKVKVSREKLSHRYSGYHRKRINQQKPQNAKGTFRRFVGLIAKYKWQMVLIAIATVIIALLNVWGPDILGEVIDAIKRQIDLKLQTNTNDFTEIKQLIFKIMAIYMGSAVLTFIQQYTLAGVSQQLVCSLRERINRKLSKLPLKFFDTNTKGDILSRITNDIDNVSNSLQSNMVTIITNVVQLITVFAIMLYTNWLMTAIIVVFVPLSTLISYRISRISKRLFRDLWDRTGELNGHIEEMYTGHSIVKLFGYEKQSIAEFDQINEDLMKTASKANFISGTINPLLTFVNNIVYVLLCFVGGYLVLNNRITLGDIAVFFAYSRMFSGPINNISQVINSVQSALASAERVFNVFDEEEEPADSSKALIKEPKGYVEFENVSFSYVKEKPLIENMNLKVNPGELIAIVGPTGSGKTTFVNLLMRFYDVDSGSIKIDGVDIRDIPRENLRSIFGMVLQDTWLFKGTFRENITYGKMNATDEEVIAAAKSARVHDFIMSYPDGYDTMLDEGGANISQGQQQLITIARAILADPAVLILDEATSSVDTRTEMHIQEAMRTLMKGRTSFVIAHRLSTIRNADKILVMRRGSIVEQGTHEELMAANGFYATLYNSQYVGGIPPEESE
ncbi:MAG TPA: ABC transporter ATP-binding protein [Clostridiales bacterium]|nr:ABC transporter ATP-binding protein [Clostridiales bacterium]HPU66567.1 ABC transporter ATP-binding protein [Clostridiales bacterium]HQA04836.1 ABC transporter ATP-binding protein [Clostridiales bacterium]HQD71845.1 ABC transporter ATP-binding protein [Clostridiales bacterium]HXK82747.1 ABC transporter ATP-binding protein [Clostridiales bacterium]